jgi:glycogen(starch) synthase
VIALPLMLRIDTDSPLAYPASFENEEPFPFFDGTEQKVARPLSVPGSPRDRTGMMTPGDFPSLQEGMENLDTDDYVGWRLPSDSQDSPQ